MSKGLGKKTGKLERWVLMMAYMKTVQRTLPEWWKFPRFHPHHGRYDYANDWEGEVDQRGLTKAEILLNYFHCEPSHKRRPAMFFTLWHQSSADDGSEGVEQGCITVARLDEKFSDSKAYHAALASYSRTIKGLEVKDYIEREQWRHEYVYDSLEVIALTEAGKAIAEMLLKMLTVRTVPTINKIGRVALEAGV